jgi:glycosyltransferase involved in cell wall biosynthesis
VAIVHSLWTLAVFGPVLRRCGLPIVLWVHGIPRSPWWIERWAQRTVPDLIVANSRYTASHAVLPFTAPFAEPVYPPLVPRHPDPAARPRLRAALGATDAAIVLIQVARVDPNKGHRMLIAALPGLRGPWMLWVAGAATLPAERAYEAALRRDVERLGLAERVRFLGERSDIAELLAAADIFVQPNTVPEGFGLALVEALAAGRPVVATDCGPTAELTGSQSARLVAPGDPAELATALQELIDDPDARRSMGAAGPAAAAISDPATVIPRLAQTLREMAT